MNEYYFTLKTSQEGIKTLVVYTLGTSFLNTIPNVVNVITGDDAERIHKRLICK